MSSDALDFPLPLYSWWQQVLLMLDISPDQPLKYKGNPKLHTLLPIYSLGQLLWVALGGEIEPSESFDARMYTI